MASICSSALLSIAMSGMSISGGSRVLTHNMPPVQAAQAIRQAMQGLENLDPTSLHVYVDVCDKSSWTIFVDGSRSLDSPPSDKPDFHAALLRSPHVAPNIGRDYAYVVWMCATRIHEGGNFEEAVTVMAQAVGTLLSSKNASCQRLPAACVS